MQWASWQCNLLHRLGLLMPGLNALRRYQWPWLRYDLVAGLSVAAVTIPAALAYATLAGLPPVLGLYTSILPLVVYALFTSSQRIITGPDSALAILLAVVVGTLAGGNAVGAVRWAAFLALLVGVLCLLAGIVHVGHLADFISRPVLTGYMNGVALSIIISQAGNLFGFHVTSHGFFRQAWEVLGKLPQTHVANFLVGAVGIAVILTAKRVHTRIPGSLLAVIGGILAAYFFRLSAAGVAMVGNVAAGLPSFGITVPSIITVTPVVDGVFGLALISYFDLILPARGFAAKHGEAINPNQEFIALGFANFAAGFSQGFAVSGSSARTAVSEASGGKTQLTGVICAIVILLVLLFLTSPLSYLPTAMLAAILVTAAIGLFDVPATKSYYYIRRHEWWLSLVTTLGVITIGVLDGILIAVALSMAELIRLAAHPKEAIEGYAPDINDYVAIDTHPGAQTIPGLLIYCYDTSLVFYNVSFFAARVRHVIAQATEPIRWFVLDARPINMLDITAAQTLDELREELCQRGMVLAVAGVHPVVDDILTRTGVKGHIGDEHIFPTLEAAVTGYQSSHPPHLDGPAAGC